MKFIYKALVNALAAYATKYNKNMVLGFSGGIDSTVAGALAYEVKTKTGLKFYGCSLPSSTNESIENEIAKTLGSFFCDSFEVKCIDTLFNFQKEQMQSTLCPEPTPLLLGNLKAKIRSEYLYNIAGSNNAIVLDTDNLTEHYLGFFTLHGDQGDVSVIGRLWKTEVYELAKYIVEAKAGVYPEEVISAIEKSIELTPTDGNGVMAGGDMAQIAPGLTYPQLDSILKDIVLHKFDLPLLMEKWLPIHSDYNLIAGIYNRHINSEFKRKQLPIVL